MGVALLVSVSHGPRALNPAGNYLTLLMISQNAQWTMGLLYSLKFSFFLFILTVTALLMLQAFSHLVRNKVVMILSKPNNCVSYQETDVQSLPCLILTDVKIVWVVSSEVSNTVPIAHSSYWLTTSMVSYK